MKKGKLFAIATSIAMAVTTVVPGGGALLGAKAEAADVTTKEMYVALKSEYIGSDAGVTNITTGGTVDIAAEL